MIRPFRFSRSTSIQLGDGACAVASRAARIVALFLLYWDCVLYGTFLASLPICSVWFLVSVVKQVIRRPGWGIALIRISIPALTLGIVLTNNAVQWTIAESHSEQIIAACEHFRVSYGRYPKTLDELLPQQLPSVPRAKYCMRYGTFEYHSDEGGHRLLWYKVPPFGRRIYRFEDGQWHYID